MARIVLTNATVLDGESAARHGQTVVVEDGVIAAVGAAAGGAARPDDQRYDLRGAVVMPGMVQAHWHGSYEGIDFTPPPVGLEKPPGYLMLMALKNAQLAQSYGFTSLIGAAVGDALDAQLKWAIADGVVSGPRIMSCGRWLITTGDCNDFPEFWWYGITAMGAQKICDGPTEFRRAVRQEIKEGAEVIKIFGDGGHALLYGKGHTSMGQDEIDAVVTAAHERGKKVRSHVDTRQGILNSIRSGIDLLDHADEMDKECVDAIVDSNTFVCPSMYFPKAVIERLEQDGKGLDNSPMAIGIKQDLKTMAEILPYAAERRAKFLIGDDWGTTMTPHGDYIKEMQLYAECGVPPLEVIRWATINAAEFMGMGDRLGTIAPGKIADLLVVNGDPSRDLAVLADRNNLRAIMQDGKFCKNTL